MANAIDLGECVAKLDGQTLILTQSGHLKDGTYVPPSEVVIAGIDNIEKLTSLLSARDHVPVDTAHYANIHTILRNLGVSQKVLGYQYVREAVAIILQDPSYTRAINYRLYPKIAEKFSTTSLRVERAIRHAIEVAFERGNHEGFVRMFGAHIDKKPTNSEFIRAIVSRMEER